MSEQKKPQQNHVAKIFQIGTAECAIFFAFLAMVLALLFLSLGFWKTVLIAVLMALGLFIGGVKDKKGWISEKINRLFPPKQTVPYHANNEEIERVVKAVKENRETEEAKDQPQTDHIID